MNAIFPLQVLVVDDDVNIRRTLSLSLKDLHCSVEQASSVTEALKKVQSNDFDLILSDFKMEGQSGLDLVRQVKANAADITIVIMTAFACFENAVDVIKEGAFDYLPKPFTTDQLTQLLNKIRQISALKRENKDLKRSKARRQRFSGFTSIASLNLEEFARKAAPTEGTVLLTGESGTGKSEIAKLIHELSPRSSQPFVTVYCTTLVESLLESELFGHVKGSFTGALQDKIGKLELADGGTIFLDEIGDLTPVGQSKILRFLQDRIFEKVGSNKEITVNTRVIAATNKNLPEEIVAGHFRQDLYFRFSVLEFILSPLRHRKEDLPILISRLFQEFSSHLPQPVPQLPQEILNYLMNYNWPGNIRELRNVIERLIMLSGGRTIQVSDLPASILKPPPTLNIDIPPICSIEEMEKDLISRVLSQESNQEKAAEILGITKVTLWRKRREYGLP